jgi:hypothetical protein
MPSGHWDGKINLIAALSSLSRGLIKLSLPIPRTQLFKAIEFQTIPHPKYWTIEHFHEIQMLHRVMKIRKHNINSHSLNPLCCSPTLPQERNQQARMTFTLKEKICLSFSVCVCVCLPVSVFLRTKHMISCEINVTTWECKISTSWVSSEEEGEDHPQWISVLKNYSET